MANVKNKKNVVADKTIGVVEAIELLKKACQEKQRKFVENVDLAVNLTIDPRQSTQNVRGSVSLPAGTGKNVKVIVFTDDESLQKEALEAGAIMAGMDELMAKVEGGFLGFDYVVATPNAMKKMCILGCAPVTGSISSSSTSSIYTFQRSTMGLPAWVFSANSMPFSHS